MIHKFGNTILIKHIVKTKMPLLNLILL